MTKEPPAPALQPSAYEHSDVSGILSACLALGLAASIVGLSLLLHAVYPNARIAYAPSSFRTMGAGPQLQIDEAGDLLALRRVEDNNLLTYGWINRNDKHIRIPIERAMQLTAERGLAGWPKP